MLLHMMSLLLLMLRSVLPRLLLLLLLRRLSLSRRWARPPCAITCKSREVVETQGHYHLVATPLASITRMRAVRHALSEVCEDVTVEANSRQRRRRAARPW